MKFQSSSPLVFLGLTPVTVHALTGGFLECCNATTFLYTEVITLFPSPGVYFTITPALSGLCKGPGEVYTNSSLNLNNCIENSNGVLLVGRLSSCEVECMAN